MKFASIALLLSGSLSLAVAEVGWPPSTIPVAGKKLPDSSAIGGRKLEIFQHGVRPEWGYGTPQRDTFVVIHPKTDRKNAPLYVVLHSAGHDVFSCVRCTPTVGNHDIYRSPDDFYALYLDCGANRGDWWWGANQLRKKNAGSTKEASNDALVPAEKRVMDTIAWAIEKYDIDPNRVYLCGNSMGGSGTLGLGMRHGDVFAAMKANVPAGVEHVSNRMFFPPQRVPAGVKLPDPPIVVDYSAQNDRWSKGHDRFIKAMNDRKYALLMYWGPFGHANNHAAICKVNDLINSFDWLAVKKNEAYPVFTNASTNDELPWPDDLKSKASGQINAFFRWKTVHDGDGRVEMSLFLTTPADLKTSFTIPTESAADVSLRRIQSMTFAPGEAFQWTFGTDKGDGKADAEGVVTVPRLKIMAKPTTLTIRKQSPGSHDAGR